MILREKRIEFLVPVFFGCLGALIFSAALSTQWLGLWSGGESSETIVQDIVYELVEESPVVTVNARFFTRPESERPDFVQEQYRNPETQNRVVEFFAEVCASPEIAAAILVHADSYDIPPALALALAWEESRFNPQAVNTKNRNESIDRGLFQLNSRTFTRLETSAFFNIDLNAKYGMSHLRHCLNTGGSEVAALAMYNAGTGRVRSSGTPKATLDYVSRILENRLKIENRFVEWESQFHEKIVVVPEIEPEPELEIAEAKPERSRLVPLMPLAGH